MADEINMSITFEVTNGFSTDVQQNIKDFKEDQTNIGGPTPGGITIGTSEENTTFPELTTLGQCFIRNLDPTNYIRFGFSTGVYGIRLEAGDFAKFRLEPGATLYMIANAAACRAIIYAMED